MKAMNLYFLTRETEGENFSGLVQELSGRVRYKEYSRHEAQSLRMLTELLIPYLIKGTADTGRNWVNCLDGFHFFSLPVIEGSSLPESVEAVPGSYLNIACAPNMAGIFRTIAAAENGLVEKGTDVTVKLLGGDLIVNYTDTRVTLTGSAVMVYEGVFEY